VRFRNFLVVAGAAVLTLVAVLIAGGAGSASPPSDADRVRAVLSGMNSSYNRSDFDGFASHVCAAMRQADGYEAGWYQSRASDGPTRITVNSVDVAGGPHPRAVANVRFQAANHATARTLDVDFFREDQEWKACRYHATRSV
jgi:hypothetical protein